MSTVVEALHDVDGADARVVAHLDSVDFTLDYIRDDLESRYSDADLDEAYRLIMANQVSSGQFEQLIGREFEAQALFFDGVLVLVCPSARYEAVFASFDRDGRLPVDELVAVASGAA